MTLTTAEKVELALIPLCGFITWIATTGLPNSLSLGRLLLYAFALLLFQGLIRDLNLLAKQKRANTDSNKPNKQAQCICLESTVGATGVIAGLIVLFSRSNHLISLNNWQWISLVVFILTTGFLIKDYQLEWWPLRLRHDKDHMNLVFAWKKK